MLPPALSTTAGRALRVVLDRGLVSRPELSEQLGVTKQTASHAITELQARQLVDAAAVHQGWTGRSAVRYALRPGAGWMAGVDLGSGRLSVAAVRLDGTVVAEHRVGNPRPTAARTWPDQLGRAGVALVDLIQQLSGPEGELFGVGLALPRPIETVQDLTAPDASPDEDMLVDALALAAPPALWTENDVNCSAIAQAWTGKVPSVTSGVALYLHVGLGLGACLMVDGVVLRGARGRAGEIAGLSLSAPLGSPTVEARLSAEGLLAAAGHSIDAPLIGAVDDLFAAALLGDQAAEAAIEGEVQGLASLIRDLAAVLDPHIVVLAGFLGARTDLRARVAAQAQAWGVAADIIGDALGDRAPARGAACLAASRVVTALCGAALRTV